MKLKYNNEMIAGGLFTIVAAVLLAMLGSQVQTRETTAITARTFPGFALVGLLVCSLGLLIQGLMKSKKVVVVNKELFQTAAARKEFKTILYIAILVAFLVLFSLFGFLVATPMLVVALMAFYGTRKWYYYAIPLAMVFVIYYVFSVVLRISLP